MLIHTKGCSSSDWKSKPSIPWAVDRFQVALNVTDRQADLVEMVYMRHFFKAAAGKSKEPVGRDSRHKHNRWENEQICTRGNNFFTEESDLSIRNNIARDVQDVHIPSSFTRGQPLLSLLKSVYLSGFCLFLQELIRLSGLFGVGSQLPGPHSPAPMLTSRVHLKASGLWSLGLAQGKRGVQGVPKCKLMPGNAGRNKWVGAGSYLNHMSLLRSVIFTIMAS